jgi:hypothetical protein
MRRSALPLLVAVCVVVAAVLAWLVVQRVVPGLVGPGGDPGPVVTQTRSTGTFDRLECKGQVEIVLIQGDRHEVTIEAPEAEQARIRTGVDGRTLTIVAREPKVGWRAFRGSSVTVPRVRVTVPTIEAIALSGAVRLAAPKLEVAALRIAANGATSLQVDSLTAQSLKLSGAGAVKADLSGRVVEQTISLSGAGDIRAGGLASETAKVSVAGAGRVVVHAEKALRVSLSGAGSVEYYGDPELSKSVSGLGRVKRRDGEPASPRSRTRFEVA